MIVTERQIHHRADFHVPIHGNRSRHDFVHAENAALWWIQDRRGKKRSVYSAVCDCKRAALQILDLQFSLARPGGEVRNDLFKLG